MPDDSSDPRPSKDLRTAEDERALQPQPDRSDDESDEPGRVQQAVRTARKKLAARRTKKKRQQLQQAKQQRERPSLSERLLGEDTAAEVASFINDVGPDPSDETFADRLAVDHDGDGVSLADELGIEDPASPTPTQTSSGVARPSQDDDLGVTDTDPFATPPSKQVARDLQAFENIGSADGRTRDRQVDRDLEALSQAGGGDRRGR